MLTDAILKEATAEAMEFRLSTLEELEQEHIFSDRFERKMKKLLHRAEHPMMYRMMRVAAMIALTVATLFGAVLAASPEIRAEVLEWIRSIHPGYIHFVTDSEHSTPEQLPPYDYRFSVIPEGYEAYRVLDSSDSKHYSFINEEENILKFSYKYPMGSSGVVIYGNYERQACDVDGMPGELYISPDGSEMNYIVWNDPETEAILWIGAWESAEKLIEIAQTVEKIHQIV